MRIALAIFTLNILVVGIFGKILSLRCSYPEANLGLSIGCPLIFENYSLNEFIWIGVK